MFASGKRYKRPQHPELGGYGLVNLFAHWVDRNWRLEARANNVLDKD